MPSVLITLGAIIATLCVIFFAVFVVLNFGLSAFRIHPDRKYLALSSAILSAGVAFVGSNLSIDYRLASIVGQLTQRNSSSVPKLPDSVPAPHEASRLFAGPTQYPPTDFAAYGTVAFPARATSSDRDRYMMLCEAYVAVLPHASELALPASQQMVTVWPVSSDAEATRINRAKRDDVCDSAVDNYGLVAATQALQDAAQVKADLDGIGPFLLAWSPSTQKGKPDALVLVANLSNVTTSDEAKLRLLQWKSDILDNPDIWKEKTGWNLDRLKITSANGPTNTAPKSTALRRQGK